jgi:hypothetical protein
MRRLFLVAALIGFLSAMLLTGCARTSPAVGTWSLPAGGNPATLTLRPDGTGALKMAVFPEQPVSWTEQDGKVTLRIEGAKTPGGARDPQTGRGASVTATLSADQKTMTLPFPTFTLTLEKQPEAK